MRGFGPSPRARRRRQSRLRHSLTCGSREESTRSARDRGNLLRGRARGWAAVLSDVAARGRSECLARADIHAPAHPLRCSRARARAAARGRPMRPRYAVGHQGRRREETGSAWALRDAMFFRRARGSWRPPPRALFVCSSRRSSAASVKAPKRTTCREAFVVRGTEDKYKRVAVKHQQKNNCKEHNNNNSTSYSQ